MFSTASYDASRAHNTPRTASTASIKNTIDVPTAIAINAQRRLFASLAGPISDAEDMLLHPGIYPVPAISKHGRQRQASHSLRQQHDLPASALASAISRKMPTLAQMVSADAADMEDTNALFALIARTSATSSMPVRVPETPFHAFNGASMLKDASRPHSRGSSSSFDYESEVEFEFEDDEDFNDAASVSSISSVESCFDFLASTKPQSQSRAQLSSGTIHVTAQIVPPTLPTASVTLFVPPQVRTHMNMLRVSRARAHSTVSNDSTSSAASSTGSWRSSTSSAFSASSRTSISSVSSVSPIPVQKTASVTTPAPAPASNASKTKYMYQGGVSTVLGGGVMLGGASAKPHQSQRTQKPTPRGPTSTYNVANTTATAPSWRRGAPTTSMFSRA